jgi:hypothetical protein
MSSGFFMLLSQRLSRVESYGVDENNPVNKMQEHLQMLCPTSRCEILWRYDDHPSCHGPFRVRIMLLNTGPDLKNLPMPYSSLRKKKKQAQKEAALLCLEWLTESGERPHDPTYLPLTVRVSSSGSQSGEREERERVEMLLTFL